MDNKELEKVPVYEKEELIKKINEAEEYNSSSDLIRAIPMFGSQESKMVIAKYVIAKNSANDYFDLNLFLSLYNKENAMSIIYQELNNKNYKTEYYGVTKDDAKWSAIKTAMLMFKDEQDKVTVLNEVFNNKEHNSTTYITALKASTLLTNEDEKYNIYKRAWQMGVEYEDKHANTSLYATVIDHIKYLKREEDKEDILYKALETNDYNNSYLCVENNLVYIQDKEKQIDILSKLIERDTDGRENYLYTAKKLGISIECINNDNCKIVNNDMFKDELEKEITNKEKKDYHINSIENERR